MDEGPVDKYPDYDMSERVVDGAVHLAGIVAAVAAITAFLALNIEIMDRWALTGLAIYWSGLLAMLLISFCYHATPWEELRPWLRRADHATIFFKIAATYTPIVLAVGTWFSYALLAVVWALALIGAGLKLLRWYPPNGMNAALYLGLSWLSVLLLWSIFQTSTAAGWCVVVGGLLYSCGVIFLLWEDLKFANAIWHGFVVVASAFLFASVWLSMTASQIAAI